MPEGSLDISRGRRVAECRSRTPGGNSGHLVAHSATRSQWHRHTAEVRTNSEVGRDGQVRRWPTPIRDREWVDESGTTWRMRGPAMGQRELRRLLKREGVRVLHVYGLEPVELSGTDLDALVRRIEAFFAGDAPPMSEFVLGDFRDAERHVMVVVQESC